MTTAASYLLFACIAILLSSLWVGVAWSLLRLFNLRSPVGRVFVLLAPLLASFVSLLRLLPDARLPILLSCTSIAVILGSIDCVRYLRFRRRVMSAAEAAASADALCQPLAAELNMPTVPVYQSRSLQTGPLVLGIRQPVIVFPTRMVSQLNVEEMQVLLAHELAHIHRRDLILKWILLFLRRLAIWNPVAAWAYRRLALEIEFACDRIACRLTGKRGTLARTLCKIDEMLARKTDHYQPVLELIPRADGGLAPRIDFLSIPVSYRFKWSNLAKTLGIFLVYWQICFRPAEFVLSLVN